jgi:hypothetical protein
VFNIRKGEPIVQRLRLIGGILLLVGAALVFLAVDDGASVPVAAGLAVVGIALVATSRKRSR